MDNEYFLGIFNDIENYPTLKDVGIAIGKNKNYVRSKVESLRAQNKYFIISRKQVKAERTASVVYKTETIEDICSAESKSIKRLEEDNKRLVRLLEEAKDHIHTSSDIRDLIYGVRNNGFDTTPSWVNEAKHKTDELIPVLFLTDLHMGEVVSAADMGFNEEYNTEICIKSANRVTEDFIDICINKMSNYTYPGCVLLLGGDGITGNLHDLSETNDTTPIKQVTNLTSLYIQQIKKLKEKFSKVAVFGVTGNHGRLDGHSYTKTKKRSDNSLETLVYHFIGEHFKDDSDVSMVTDESDEILFGINGRKFLLTHGDRGIKGGNGIGGIIVPIKRARSKMLQGAVAMNKEFNTLIIGHFHQHFMSDDLVIGASLKPYDEYCKSMGFEYGRAGATTFFVNSSGDMIFSTHLKVRSENKTKTKRNKSIELF